MCDVLSGMDVGEWSVVRGRSRRGLSDEVEAPVPGLAGEKGFENLNDPLGEEDALDGEPAVDRILGETGEFCRNLDLGERSSRDGRRFLLSGLAEAFDFGEGDSSLMRVSGRPRSPRA